MEKSNTHEKKGYIGNMVALSLIVIGLTAIMTTVSYALVAPEGKEYIAFALYASVMTSVIGATEFYIKRFFLGQFVLSVFLLVLSLASGVVHQPVTGILIGIAGLILLAHSYSVSEKRKILTKG